MDPTVWGPRLWFVIHTIALNYPDNPSYDQKRIHEDFFNSLVFLIPCDKCRIHYRQHINNNPVVNHLKNSDTLFRYTIDLHNEVNKSLGKKIYSYEEVAKIYRNHYNKPYSVKNIKNKIFNVRNLIILIVLIVIGVLIKVYRNKYTFRIIKSR